MSYDNLDAVAGYCRDVLNGTIPACELTKLAIKRHLKDLDDVESGDREDIYFDEQEAIRKLKFFSFLRHSKGEWAGTEFELEPWQQFILACVFGWKRASDDTRRFRTVYEEIPRKNGKTTKIAGVGLIGLTKDDEPGAEVYIAATKREQAKIAFDEAYRMVSSSPALSKRVGQFRNNLHVIATASKFEPLGRDSDSTDGLNIYYGLVDEIHAHKTREMWDVLETATGSRRQPLMWAITTAGFNKNGIGYELRGYAIKVLNGFVDDDSFFGIIYSIDDGDDWKDPSVWAKANPNLGVSVKMDDLERKCKKAIEMPSARNNFLCKHLNVWTNAETLWMNMEKWESCSKPFAPESLKGRKCYGGLDLASVSDIAALALLFPREEEGEKHKIVMRYYLPEDAVKDRTEKNNVPYHVWAEDGIFQLTPGNVTDYNFIKRDITELAELYDIREIAFDRWNSSQLVNDLMNDGANMIAVGQGYASMSAPMKELEKLVLSEEISHNGDPVLTWMASNLVAKEDEAGNIKPDKSKSVEKIDGMAALIMALSRMIASEESEKIIGDDYELMVL